MYYILKESWKQNFETLAASFEQKKKDSLDLHYLRRTNYDCNYEKKFFQMFTNLYFLWIHLSNNNRFIHIHLTTYDLDYLHSYLKNLILCQQVINNNDRIFTRKANKESSKIHF